MSFLAGQRLRASQLQGPLFSAIQTIAQSIPNNVFTAVTFTTETIDTHSLHSTSVNTSRVTVTSITAGYYRVSGVGMVIGTTGRRAAAIAKNGAIIPGTVTIIPATATFDTSIPTNSKIIQMVAGDYLELFVFQDSGGARNTVVLTEYACGLDIEFLY